MTYNKFESIFGLRPHSSWQPFFDAEVLAHLTELARKLEHDGPLSPPFNAMLRFLELDLQAVKIVVLGQDPYPQKGVATGRAFEVGPLQSWYTPFRNTSLRNIVRALYAAQNKRILTFKEVLSEMRAGRFELAPPAQLFKQWEQQGVLLINTSFSCRIGVPGSHAALWAPFTRQLLAYIHRLRPDLRWLLWGKHAQGVVAHLSGLQKIESRHPMICQDHPDDFLFGRNPFAKVSDIDWLGCP